MVLMRFVQWCHEKMYPTWQEKMYPGENVPKTKGMFSLGENVPKRNYNQKLNN